MTRRNFSLEKFDQRLESTRLTDFEKRGYFDAAEKLQAFCKRSNVYVFVNDEWNARFWWDEGAVDLCRRYSPMRQVHSWLHELGHSRINKVLYNVRFAYDFTNVYNARGHADRLIVLDRELDAWYEARVLIEELDLCIRRKEFTEQETSSLMTYVRWAHAGGARFKKRK